MPTVWIPAPLRDLTGGRVTVEVAGSTVRQVIESLEAAYPGMKARLCDGERLKPGVRVAVDSVVAPLGMLQPVSPESEVTFVQAVGGGAGAGTPRQARMPASRASFVRAVRGEGSPGALDMGGRMR